MTTRPYIGFAPYHEESYESNHGQKPRGRGRWAFVAPDGSLVRVPMEMTYSEAKAWLKKNATISGQYKVAHARTGAKVRHGRMSMQWDGSAVTIRGRQYRVVENADGMCDLYDLSTGKKWKAVPKTQLDEWLASGVIRDTFRRTGAKSRFGTRTDPVIRQALDTVASQIDDQPELAKKNIKKVAELMGWHQSTDSDWKEFLVYARKLGFSDSAIAGFSRTGEKPRFEKSDDYARILMQPVTSANCGRMLKTAKEAMAHAKSVGDDDLFELAEEIASKCRTKQANGGAK
jgi:hypothetical protein